MKIKKIFIVVSMLAVMLSISGCKNQEKDTFEYDDSDLVLNTMTEFTNYAGVSDEYASYYIENGTEFEKSAVKGIRQAIDADKVGKFQDYSIILANQQQTGIFSPESVDYSIKEDKGAVLVTIINRAENRDVEITVKYVENPDYFKEYDKAIAFYSADNIQSLIEQYGLNLDDLYAQYSCTNMEELAKALADEEMSYQNLKPYLAQEMVVSAVYSRKELMASAGKNTLIGMGTVFVVLIFISFIISLFKFLPALFAPKTKMPEAKPAAAPAAKPVVANDDLMNDSELVAVITAAIYAATQGAGQATSKDRLVVRSIKRVKR